MKFMKVVVCLEKNAEKIVVCSCVLVRVSNLSNYSSFAVPLLPHLSPCFFLFRLALLKQGADATLYNSGKRIISDSTSEHTHGESGIGENSNRLVSNRDSLSNHSHDELEPGSDFLPSPPRPTEAAQPPVFKQKALLPTPTDLQPLDLAQTMTEVDFNNNEAQVVQPPVQNSQQSSKIISTSNGRITTALTITLSRAQGVGYP